ncbi:sigma-70 family RNA polymerase sigma factor [Maribacter sp. CXY002]|uniref:sigma-70 family RNA polymerase sigma factor n=1 Tax=Maribacter luteocoastalis TaxID=3407671 RepID=UPI003B678C8C
MKVIVKNKETSTFHTFVSDEFVKLEQLKKEENKVAFNEHLLKVMPEVERYIENRLKREVANHKLDRGKYKKDDFIDQLYLLVYDNFDEVSIAKELHTWLFKKADELLEDALVEEEFDTLFFDNIDDYTQLEWEGMEEEFSADGDGDLIMMDELDDISYQKKENILKNIFLEDSEGDSIAKINQEIGASELQKHINMVLYKLPTPIQTVYELFTVHQFDVSEIAKIRNKTEEEIMALLEAALENLQLSILSRFKK